MEPPICSVCQRDQRDYPELEFELVKFNDYEPIEHPGHPDGLLWLCQDHSGDARSLSDFSSQDATQRLRRQSKSPRWIQFLKRVFIRRN